MSATAASALAFEENLAVMAGAGAGKTHGLITLCLHLLGGARADAVPLRPSQLCLVTFTDKAAGELRLRLRSRVEGLARAGLPEDAEPELRQSFERLEKAWPPPSFWREQLQELGGASVGTFHALCMQLLRRAPPALEAAPAGFELLDERAAFELLEDTAERVVLDALEADEVESAELCRELDFRGYGFGNEGVTGALVRVFSKLREEGSSAERIPIGDAVQARVAFDAALTGLVDAAAELSALAGMEAKPSLKFTLTASDARAALQGMRYENFAEPFDALRAAVARDPNLLRGGAPNLAAAAKRLKYGTLGDKKTGAVSIAALHAAVDGVRLEGAFRTLLARLEARHRVELERLGLMDFSELILRARNLLRDVPEYRAEVQHRFQALLVDEFQDTNRLQLELVTLLAEARGGAPRALEPTAEAVLGLPLEPRFLCVVGDRKQSIYEFRGADVGVFEAAARAIEAGGGRRTFLQRNRRSVPELLGFFNGVFSAVLRPRADPRDFEVGYAPATDDLEPVRPSLGAGPCVERLVLPEMEVVGEARLREADALAIRIAQMLAPETALSVAPRDSPPRPARGGDIAILFRSFTSLEVYRQALARQGVPHRVVRGRGFYGAQEIVDVASFLAWVSDPADTLSLAAVLRSPIVGLSDASLFRLSLEGGGALESKSLSAGVDGRRFPLPEEEQARVDALVSLAGRLREERGRLGLRGALGLLMRETQLRVRLAATPFGDQALANLDKLQVFAERWDSLGRGDLARFADTLLALADDEPREAQAEPLDLGDERAVQLLTIHAAKGLEWPVVCVPDLGAKPRSPDGGAVVYDRQLGLAIRPRPPHDTQRVDSERSQAIRDELKRREFAESARVLYVALTRARDHLLLSGQAGRTYSDSWRHALDALCDGPLREQVLDVEGETLEPPPAAPADVPAPTAAEHALAGRVLARVRSPRRPTPSARRLPLAMLHDASLCMRRMTWTHGVRLPESPSFFERPPHPEDEPAELLPSHPDAYGPLLHEVIRNWTAARSAEALLDAVGVTSVDPVHARLTRALGHWSASRVAARLEAMGDARAHRSLPFLLDLAGSGPRVEVHGTLDFLVEDEEGGATVLDVVAAAPHPAGLEVHTVRLQALAQAASSFILEGTRLRAGLIFVWDSGCQLALAPEDLLEPETAAKNLAAHADGFATLAEAATPAPIPRERCVELRCGFFARCHAPGPVP